jgi:hypothetical protein
MTLRIAINAQLVPGGGAGGTECVLIGLVTEKVHRGAPCKGSNTRAVSLSLGLRWRSRLSIKEHMNQAHTADERAARSFSERGLLSLRITRRIA